jgi:hypothetical protein
MDWKDVSTGVGFLIVVAGWFFLRWKDRNHEIFKVRLEKILDMYDCVTKAIVSFTRGGGIKLTQEQTDELFVTASLKIQMFGQKDEMDEFHKFASSIEQRDLDLINASLKVLPLMMVNNLRKELGFKSIP